MPKSDLRIDWCTHEAAKYAVEHWHYSRSLPPPPHVRVGVWECGAFIGLVLFSRGATPELLSPYGLSATEGCELVRVALTTHTTPVSRIVSIALKFLRRQCPGLRLVVSFADPSEGHHGGIYQAGGWVCAGMTAPSVEYIGPDGKRWHGRMVSPRGVKTVYGRVRRVLRPDQCTRVDKPGKHRYLMPLDDAMRAQVAPLAKPYPKRIPRAETSAPRGTTTGAGGATPTSALPDRCPPASPSPPR